MKMPDIHIFYVFIYLKEEHTFRNKIGAGVSGRKESNFLSASLLSTMAALARDGPDSPIRMTQTQVPGPSFTDLPSMPAGNWTGSPAVGN